jgi:hypothetical protein
MTEKLQIKLNSFTECMKTEMIEKVGGMSESYDYIEKRSQLVSSVKSINEMLAMLAEIDTGVDYSQIINETLNYKTFNGNNEYETSLSTMFDVVQLENKMKKYKATQLSLLNSQNESQIDLIATKVDLTSASSTEISTNVSTSENGMDVSTNIGIEAQKMLDSTVISASSKEMMGITNNGPRGIGYSIIYVYLYMYICAYIYIVYIKVYACIHMYVYTFCVIWKNQ